MHASNLLPVGMDAAPGLFAEAGRRVVKNKNPI